MQIAAGALFSVVACRGRRLRVLACIWAAVLCTAHRVLSSLQVDVNGQSLSSSWLPLHQPVFCICFTNLESHLESTFLQGIIYFILPCLAKTEGKGIAEIDKPPSPPPPKSV